MTRSAITTLYDSLAPSGNGYKVRLLLAHLGLTETVEVIDLDLLQRPPQTRLPDFLAKNPNGRIPLARLADGTYLPESNAILFYLAQGSPYLSADPVEQARTLSWMFFEQYSHERFIAVLKFWTYWGGLDKVSAADLATWRTQGQAALEVMEQHLRGTPFFSGQRYGIADIALFAYTQSAGAIGYEVAPLGALRAWLDAVRAQPGFIPIKADPFGRAPVPR